MKLRFLHLSDLHFRYRQMIGDNWPTEEFNRDMVARSMLEYIEKHIVSEEKIDFITITGDLAYAGKREDYEVAEVFCKRLLIATGVPENRFYLVPGNHDVNRDEVPEIHSETFYKFETQDKVSMILGDPVLFPALMKKFSEFNHFAEIMMGRRLYDEKVYHLVENLNLEKTGQTFKINLVGLNSALFAGYDHDDQQKLALGLRQVDRALNQMPKEALLSIGFFHHPFSCYHKSDKVCQNMLKEKLNLILTGHLHEPTNAVVQDEAGRAVIIGAGACYETRETQNHFDTVEIDLTTGEGRVQYYKYLTNRNRWYKDSDINPDGKEGQFPFTIEAIRDNPLVLSEKIPPKSKLEVKTNGKIEPVPERPTQIFFIHDFLLPENFTGRKDEQFRLRNIIKEKIDPSSKKSISLATVRAFAGIGKSCLLRKVVEECGGNSRFSFIIWFSFYEAKTEDQKYFLQQVLSRLGSQEINDDKQKLNGASEVKHLRETLCRYLDSNPVLLILDGLEVIQYTADESYPRFGQITSSYREVHNLLTHICNQGTSAAIVSSRTTLTEFSGISGYLEITLEVFTPEEGAEFLGRMGVKGSKKELMHCSELFKGHALCLKAVGRYMTDKRISAAQVEEITGDPKVFQRSSDGERLTKIINTIRKELKPEQEYFLKMLSLHTRSVSQDNFMVLIENYGESGHDANWVFDYIILPLRTKGLIEELKDSEGNITYSAHPLMKLAFSTWLSKLEKRQSHERWAEAAKSSPAISYSASKATSLEELGPYLDAVEHYLKAGNFGAASDIYLEKGVAIRTYFLGYANVVEQIGKRFAEAVESKVWNPNNDDRGLLFNTLGLAYNALSLEEKALKYFRKQFDAAIASGDDRVVLGDGSILARSLILNGQIDQGIDLLESLKRKVEKQEKESNNPNYFFARATAELYGGKYRKSIPFLKKALENFYEPYDLVNSKLGLAEIYLRLGELTKAESLLNDALKQAENQRISVLISHICDWFTYLALKRRDLKSARYYNNLGIDLRKQLALPAFDDGFLLVAEGKYNQAIRETKQYISTEEEDKIDKNSEITGLIILSQAWYGKGDKGKAIFYLNQAESLMKKTGCWRQKNRLNETRVLLGIRKKRK